MGSPHRRLLCPINHPLGMRRSPACLDAPCSKTSTERTPSRGSSPARVPVQSVSSSHLIQEPSGLAEPCDVSRHACPGLRTPADLQALAMNRALRVGFQDVQTVAIRGLLSRSCTSTSGSAISPTAYRILCVRLPRDLVRGLRRSAAGPTLDTGGRLTLARPGLSPSKRRRALLGAITYGGSRRHVTVGRERHCGMSSPCCRRRRGCRGRSPTFPADGRHLRYLSSPRFSGGATGSRPCALALGLPNARPGLAPGVIELRVY